METRQGNPASVTILYLALAKALELPVKYVPYPRYPLLAYVDRELAQHIMGENAISDVIFYINPANRGSITGRKELEYHLKKNNYIPVEDYIEPVDEGYILLKLLDNLNEAYKVTQSEAKASGIRELGRILSKTLK